MERCKSCGQLLPLRDLPDGVHLSVTEKRVWEALQRWPRMSGRDLHKWLYQDHEDGGIEDENVTRVFVSKINRKVRPYGLEITGKDHDGYRIQRRSAA